MDLLRGDNNMRALPMPRHLQPAMYHGLDPTNRNSHNLNSRSL